MRKERSRQGTLCFSFGKFFTKYVGKFFYVISRSCFLPKSTIRSYNRATVVTTYFQTNERRSRKPFYTLNQQISPATHRHKPCLVQALGKKKLFANSKSIFVEVPFGVLPAFGRNQNTGIHGEEATHRTIQAALGQALL